MKDHLLKLFKEEFWNNNWDLVFAALDRPTYNYLSKLYDSTSKVVLLGSKTINEYLTLAAALEINQRTTKRFLDGFV